MMTVQWFPPTGKNPINFDEEPFALVSVEGIGSTLANPKTRQEPGQVGVTLLGTAVDARVITLEVELAADSPADLLGYREALAAALVALPPGQGQPTPLGLLRIHREGHEPRDIPAVPRQSPDFTHLGPTYAAATLEFLCPYPFFMEQTDRVAVLETEGGFTFPLAMPFAMPSHNVTSEIIYSASIPAPVLIRFSGPCEAPRLENLTTGQRIGVTTALAEGESIEIDTAAGHKRISLVQADGTRSNAMADLDLEHADFWHLVPGPNVVRFSAAVNEGGRAMLFWRQRYAGI